GQDAEQHELAGDLMVPVEKDPHVREGVVAEGRQVGEGGGEPAAGLLVRCMALVGDPHVNLEIVQQSMSYDVLVRLAIPVVHLGHATFPDRWSTARRSRSIK